MSISPCDSCENYDVDEQKCRKDMPEHEDGCKAYYPINDEMPN